MLALLLSLALQASPTEPVWEQTRGLDFGTTLYCPQGERLLTFGEKTTLWDLASGERIARLAQGRNPRLTKWSFDITGRLIVSGTRQDTRERTIIGLTLRDGRTGAALQAEGLDEIIWYPSTSF